MKAGILNTVSLIIMIVFFSNNLFSQEKLILENLEPTFEEESSETDFDQETDETSDDTEASNS